MRFSPDGNHLALFGSKRVVVVLLNTPDVPKVVLSSYKLDTSKFQAILDLQIVSELKGRRWDFNCEIACMHAKYQRVQIINVKQSTIKKEDKKGEEKKMINFMTKDLEGINVKISDDLNKVIFCSKKENYILEYDQ